MIVADARVIIRSGEWVDGDHNLPPLVFFSPNISKQINHLLHIKPFYCLFADGDF